MSHDLMPAIRAAIEGFAFDNYGLDDVDPRSEYAEWVGDLASAIAGAVGDDETSAADFFEPGRTYRDYAWLFRCDAVTTHPETGTRTALGWTSVRASGWTTYSHDEAHWADGDWTDITEIPARCGRCCLAFDPTGIRWNGHARHSDTDFCIRCVDRCHDSEDAGHRCPICANPAPSTTPEDRLCPGALDTPWAVCSWTIPAATEEAAA